MLKFIVGVVLFWLTLKLAYYLRAITPAYNRPSLFRNPLAFTALNILMLILPILAGWFVLAALFGFRAPFGLGD
jgi:hypothetical protein